MKIIDSHVHIGDYLRIKEILKNTKYINKFRLYSAINPDVIIMQNKYLDDTTGYFAIPIVFKEIDIFEENNYVINKIMRDERALPVPLIDQNRRFVEGYSLIFKEHFLLHNYLDMKLREDTYTYLNKWGGFLLLHSDDSIRIPYIKKLINNYPYMNIIIAHMGRNVFEDYQFSADVIDHFYKNENILFDTSTITNPEIIKYGIARCGSERILYGSDFPYEKKVTDIEENFIRVLYKLKSGDFENIVYNNSNKIKKYCKRCRYR